MPVLKVTNVVGIGLEPGVYPAQVKSVSEESGKFGPQVAIEWKLTVTDEDGNTRQEERKTWAGIKDSNGPRSKLYQIASALLNGGEAFADDYEIDTDDFIGKRCQLVVAPTTDQNGKSKIDITTYLPPKKAKSNAAIAKEIDEL